jgi:hypothetical protein
MEQTGAKLKCIEYNESVLVDKVCTDAQRKAYRKKNKFVNSTYRKMFLDTLSRYCDYEYDAESKKYRITEVFDYPITLAESRIHKGIYQYLTPLILNEVLFGEESTNRKAVITSVDLARSVGMINENYNVAKFNQDAMQTDLDFSSAVLAEYFNKADNRMDEYIRRCIKYLKSMNCVIYNETHMISLLPQEVEIENGRIIIKPHTIRRATDDEMKLYASLVDQAAKQAKITSDNEKWYGKKALKYRNTLTALLREHNIEFVCRAFELWRVDTDRCKSIMRSFADKTIDQRRHEIGYLMQTVMDTNAENRLIKNPSLGANYLEQFKKLSDIVMPPDAEDIRPKLKSIKEQDLQEKLKNKYNYEIEYAISGGE